MEIWILLHRFLSYSQVLLFIHVNIVVTEVWLKPTGSKPLKIFFNNPPWNKRKEDPLMKNKHTDMHSIKFHQHYMSSMFHIRALQEGSRRAANRSGHAHNKNIPCGLQPVEAFRGHLQPSNQVSKFQHVPRLFLPISVFYLKYRKPRSWMHHLTDYASVCSMFCCCIEQHKQNQIFDGFRHFIIQLCVKQHPHVMSQRAFIWCLAWRC